MPPCWTKFITEIETEKRGPKDRDAVRRKLWNYKDDLARRVQDSFRKIPVVATALNKVSDNLNISAKRIEAVLKKHPLGVASWVKFTGGHSPDGMSYYYEQVGFAKPAANGVSPSARLTVMSGMGTIPNPGPSTKRRADFA